MYLNIKSVIESGRFELTDMLRKIDIIWLQSDITDEQKEELVNLAIDKAYRDEETHVLLTRVLERVGVLEHKVAKLENGGTEPEPPVEEYPEWIPYDGVNPQRYMKDSKVTHNGEKYISMIDNNTWEPGADGVDDRIWKKVVEVKNTESEDIENVEG